MVTIKFGKTVITGYLMGYNPGSDEFEIELESGLKVNIPAKTEMTHRVFPKMRVSMNAIGLSKLRSSVLDFNKGKIELLDLDKSQRIQETPTVNTSFVV